MDRYEPMIKLLGSGGQGQVYEVKRKSDGKIIALKVITSDNFQISEFTKKEVEILKKLSEPKCNPFIICYYGTYYDKNKVLIEMELVRGTDMLDFVNQARTKEELYYYLLLIAKDLAKGLEYIHSKGVIHNDIKLENILIDTFYVPRIIDFGLGCQTEKKNYCSFAGGSPFYIAPEFFADNSNDKRDAATDMWALGITLFTAAHGYFPYKPQSENIQDLFQAIINDLPEKSITGNVRLDTIINGLLSKNPQARLTSSEMLKLLEVIPRPASIKVPLIGKGQKGDTIIIRTDKKNIRDSLLRFTLL